MNDNNGASPSVGEFDCRMKTPQKIAASLTVAVLMCLITIGNVSFVGLPVMIAVASLNTVLLIGSSPSKLMPLLVTLLNLAPVAAAVLISGGEVLPLDMLYPILAALPIWLCHMLKKGRTTAIASSAALSAALIAVIVVVAVYQYAGEVSVEAFNRLLDAFLEPVKAMIAEINAQYAEASIDFQITEEDIEWFVYLYKTVIFGGVCSALMICSYIITLFARLIMKLIGIEGLLPYTEMVQMIPTVNEDGTNGITVERARAVWRINPSAVSAVVFILSYLAAMLFSLFDGTVLHYSVAANIETILLPVFVYCGVRTIFGIIRNRRRFNRKNGLLIAICIAAAVFVPTVFLSILGLIGATTTVRVSLAASMAAKHRGGGREE